VRPTGHLRAAARGIRRVPHPAAVAGLREQTEDGRLDFKRDIEPLIRLEALGRMSSATPAEIATVERILTPTATCRRATALRGNVGATAEADLAEAQRGLGVSLVKEGLEILRDHRDALRPPSIHRD